MRARLTQNKKCQVATVEKNLLWVIPDHFAHALLFCAQQVAAVLAAVHYSV